MSRFGGVADNPSKAKKDLSFSVDRDRPWIRVLAYAVDDSGRVRVPRYYPTPVVPAKPLGNRQPIPTSFPLRPELGQIAAYDSVNASWEATGGAVLSLPTGHGKTCVAIKLLCDLGAKTLVLCHKGFLLDQWKDRLASFAPAAKVTVVRGNEYDISGDVVLATVQTLVSRQHHHTPAFDCFGLLVFDECHHVAAQVFSKVMFGCTFARTLGLTATPDRRDGLGHVVELFLGPLCYRGESKREAPEILKITYASDKYKAPPPCNAKGTVCYASLLNCLAEDPDRTRFVANVVRDEVLNFPDRRVLVLSHRRGLCEALGELLEGSFVYMGGKSSKDPPPQSAHVVVASWSLVSEGFDDPTLDTLVLATPATDVVQAIGRVGRSGKRGKVIDVVDAWGPCFAQFSKRKRAYGVSGAHANAAAPPEKRPSFLFV